MNQQTASGGEGRAWYRIDNRAGTNGPAELYLYDEVGAWGVSAGDFVKDLRDVTANTIDLHINSPGGDVFDGIAIYNALRNHRATVNVTVDGIAASAASFISQAGDRITMARNAQMMIHEGHGVCVGNSKDMAAMTDLLDKCSDNIADIYAQRAGGTVADWRARMRAETWYTAAEAVKAGLADEVASADSRVDNSWDLSIFNFAGRDKAPDPFGAGGPIPATATGQAELGPEVIVVAESGPEVVVTAQTSVVAPPAAHDHCEHCGHQPPEPLIAEADWNPGYFRDLMQAMATDAPAAPPLPLRPVDLGPALPPPEPVPEPPPASVWDQVRAAVQIAANDAPAPPQPHNDTESPADEPGFFMDAPAFTTALRRAKL